MAAGPPGPRPRPHSAPHFVLARPSASRRLCRLITLTSVKETRGSRSPLRRRLVAWCLLPLALALAACKAQHTTTIYEDDTFSLLMVVDMGALGSLASGDSDPCLTSSTGSGLPDGFTSYRNIGTASSPICEFRSDRTPIADGTVSAVRQGDEYHFTVPPTDVDKNPDMQILNSAGLELSMTIVFPGPVISSPIGTISDNKVIISSLDDLKRGGLIVASAKGPSDGADQPHSPRDVDASPTATASPEPTATPSSPAPTATPSSPAPTPTPTAVTSPDSTVTPSGQAAPPTEGKDNKTLYATLGAIAASAVLGIILVLLLQRNRPSGYPGPAYRG